MEFGFMDKGKFTKFEKMHIKHISESGVTTMAIELRNLHFENNIPTIYVNGC